MINHLDVAASSSGTAGLAPPLRMEIGLSRKRLRRSTRSCYQCRRRKVKCQLTEESVETCAECIKSGTQCTLQLPEAEPGRGHSPGPVDKQEYESRLERIESLLKKLVEAQEQPRAPERPSAPGPTASSAPWDGVVSPTKHVSEDEQLLRLYQLPPSPADGSLPLADNGLAMPQPADTQDSRQSLVSLLPSAQDAATIVMNTTASLWGAENPAGSILRPDDALRLLEVAAVPGGRPMHIAKALVLFALYMQQLPADLDAQLLGSQSIEDTIRRVVERVKLFVLSHKDEAGSLDGLECLILLGAIEMNDGKIRDAWMTFRRVLDISRLSGFHNSFSVSARSSPCSDTALRRRLWLSAVCGDCYCSLLLGLEPGLGIAPFGPEDESWDDPLAEEDANVQRRICLAIGRIAQRNAVGNHQDRHTLQDIDESLDRLQRSLPSSWWRSPTFRQDRPLDSAKEPNRLICQLWFFQARMLVHLPVAFGEPADESMSSLETCMEVSRSTLTQYLGLQRARDQLSRCRIVDQSAFLAAVIMILARVQLRCHNTYPMLSRDSDRALLEQVTDLFEAVGRLGPREHVAGQCFEILSTMLGIAATGPESMLLTMGNSTPDTPLPKGTPFDVEVALEGTPSHARPGMEDIIASSIRPALGVNSPASRLVNILLATNPSASGASEDKQEPSYYQTGLGFDDFVDPSFLQHDPS